MFLFVKSGELLEGGPPRKVKVLPGEGEMDARGVGCVFPNHRCVLRRRREGPRAFLES